MKKIHLLYPTARPDKFRETIQFWLDNAISPENICVRVAVDSQEHCERLSEYDVIVVNNPRCGITTPLLALSHTINCDNHDDIIVVPSDDFFCPPAWDIYLLEKHSETNYEVLQVNDAHQHPLITMPVLTYNTLLKLGRVVYHPVYNHMFSDQEAYDVAKELNILTVAEKSEPIFEHKNPMYGGKKDDVNRAVNAGYYDMKKIYQSRKGMNVYDKIKV